jgi:hypothetical protein
MSMSLMRPEGVPESSVTPSHEEISIMIASRRAAGCFLLVALALPVRASAQAPPSRDNESLSEERITRLVNTLKIKPEVVAGMVRERGIGFAADAEALERLKKARVPDLVLDAVREAGKPRAEADTAPAVTFEQVTEMLRERVPEAAIRERVQGTVFTLGRDQVEELRKLGASEALIQGLGAARLLDPRNEIANLAVLLDCSGSMGDRTPDGSIKMEAAKRAATELVRDAPEGLYLTFLIYGHDKAEACDAVKIVRPLTPIDAPGKEALVRMIGGQRPVGSTPIALALRTAGRELATARGASGVVLISDGKEMCGGSPATEAATLARDLKLGFGVQVVGFGVKPDEKGSLAEIARAGQGNYYDAPTSAKLQDVVRLLARAVERGERPEPERGGETASAGGMTPRLRALAEQLKDESAEARGEAAEALGRLGDKARAAVPALMDRIADDVWGDPKTAVHRDNSSTHSSKDNALEALHRIAPEKVEEALVRATKSENPRVRSWASSRLGDDPPAKKRR